MMRLRPLAFLCAILALGSVVCTTQVGGGFGQVMPDGQPCGLASDCASNACLAGKCAPPPAGVIEIDGDCSGGEPCVGDATCEDGICVQTSASACAEDGQSCVTSSDCCASDCYGHTCGSTGTGGSATCLALGTPCTSDDDCCNGLACTSYSAFRCCFGSNDACTRDSDCCSGNCGGVDMGCLAPCSSAGAPCSMPSDCCSKSCDTDTFSCK